MSNLIVTNINGFDAEAGKAKSWFNYRHTTNTVYNSFNISSITDTGTGNFFGNLINDHSDSQFACVGGSRVGSSWDETFACLPSTTSTLAAYNYTGSGSPLDTLQAAVATFGGLA